MVKKKVDVPSNGAIELLSRIAASHHDVSRGDLADLSGLSRVTIGQRLRELFNAKLICEGDEGVASGGRPKRPLELNSDVGRIACIDVGETHLHVGISDLAPRILSDVTVKFDLKQPPALTLKLAADTIEKLLTKLGAKPSALVGIGMSLPAPVKYHEGTVVGPSVMVGWDNFAIIEHLHRLIPVPVFVDNDVNILAMSAVVTQQTKATQIAYVKVGTGIGCGNHR